MYGIIEIFLVILNFYYLLLQITDVIKVACKYIIIIILLLLALCTIFKQISLNKLTKMNRCIDFKSFNLIRQNYKSILV